MTRVPALTPATARVVAESCLCLSLQRATRVVARRYDEALRPLGLTNGQFSLLMSLNRQAPPTVGELAAELAMDRTTLTAALKPLERDGFVISLADRDDARRRVLTLTPAGRTLLQQALPLWREVQRRTAAGLAGEADALRAQLRVLAG